MNRRSVDSRVEFDATQSWQSIRGVHETNERRTLALDIVERGNRFQLEMRTDDPELVDRLGNELQRAHPLYLTRATLSGVVQECRQAWRRHVVDRLGSDGTYQFQYGWDFSGDATLRRDVLPLLAVAGTKLFQHIFYPRPPDRGPYEGLQRIGKVLHDHLAGGSRCIRIVSDSFYVPWSLIYTGDPNNPNDVRPEGFLGYQHLIEHSPEQAGSLAYEIAEARPLKIGLQLDDRIDTELQVECLRPVRELLSSYETSDISGDERVNKGEVATAFRRAARDDQVLYFCCHAHQEGDFTAIRPDQGYLVLGDRPLEDLGNRITPSDFAVWMGLNYLDRHPIVFLNACQGGQLTSTFYKGFGDLFLGLRASSVVGPQTEIPAVFAGQFARAFFSALFDGSKSVGQVLFDLRRKFMDEYNNPLGLTYSLYRGADTRIGSAVRRRAAARDGRPDDRN